jgi:hypothetical protein
VICVSSRVLFTLLFCRVLAGFGRYGYCVGRVGELCCAAWCRFAVYICYCLLLLLSMDILLFEFGSVVHQLESDGSMLNR